MAGWEGYSDFEVGAEMGKCCNSSVGCTLSTIQGCVLDVPELDLDISRSFAGEKPQQCKPRKAWYQRPLHEGKE